MNSTGMLPVNVNGSDAARLRASDEWLGCTVLRTVLERTTPEVAAAIGLPPYQVRGVLLPWAGSPTTPLIDLRERQRATGTMLCVDVAYT